MDFLIHLFHILVTYPVLNLFIWLYEQNHSFSLTIILIAFLFAAGTLLEAVTSSLLGMLTSIVVALWTAWRGDS